MTNTAFDDVARLRFDWPEPVLIDLIGDSYGEPPQAPDRLEAARIHTRFLHALVDGEIRLAASLRVKLITCCAARGIGQDAIERADQAAFLEMMRIARGRFRNSPKLCLAVMRRLHVALARLPAREPKSRPPAPRRLWATRPAKAPMALAPVA